MPFLQLCFTSVVLGRSWRIQCYNRITISLLGYTLDMKVMACLAHICLRFTLQDALQCLSRSSGIRLWHNEASLFVLARVCKTCLPRVLCPGFQYMLLSKSLLY